MKPELVVDDRDFQKRMTMYEAQANAKSREQFERNVKDVFDQSQKLVPVRTGALKASGHWDIRDTKDGVEGSVAYDAPHATKVHYGMTPAPGAEMQPAHPNTSTEFGPSGGLYLQRPLLGKAKRYSQAIADYLKRTVGR